MLVVILALAAVAAVVVGGAGLAGRLPENGVVGVRTEQTLSDPLLWRTANRVAGPGLVAAGVIFGGGALIGLAMDAPWSYVAVVVAVVIGGADVVDGGRAHPGDRRHVVQQRDQTAAHRAPRLGRTATAARGHRGRGSAGVRVMPAG